MVRSYWPDRVERITGVPAAQLDEAARLLGEASTAMVLTARGSKLHLQPVPGTDLALANGLLHLAIRLGYIDTA